MYANLKEATLELDLPADTEKMSIVDQKSGKREQTREILHLLMPHLDSRALQVYDYVLTIRIIGRRTKIEELLSVAAQSGKKFKPIRWNEDPNTPGSRLPKYSIPQESSHGTQAEETPEEEMATAGTEPA